jgi:hypothetical protein
LNVQNDLLDCDLRTIGDKIGADGNQFALDLLRMSPLSPPELPPAADRRPERRRRTLLGGRVTFNDGAHVFDCTIRDLSKSGARITVPGQQPIASHVYLINIRDRVVYDAVVVWNRGGHAGLSFQKTLQLAELTDKHLDYLKRLWLERAMR